MSSLEERERRRKKFKTRNPYARELRENKAYEPKFIPDKKKRLKLNPREIDTNGEDLASDTD